MSKRAEVEHPSWCDDDGNPFYALEYWESAGEGRGPGWYYYDDEYPDEGSCGPFETKAQAEIRARLDFSDAPYADSEDDDATTPTRAESGGGER